jgi:type IV secretion system protein VirB6
MNSSSNYAPFYVFDLTIQQPFTNGMNATVSSAMSTIQGPLTVVIVLWIIISGLLVIRGDVDARSGVTRLIKVSFIVGILMSATLYNEYVVSFFTVGLPDWLAGSFVGVNGTQPSAHQFDAIWNEADILFANAEKNMNFYNVLYSVELGAMRDFVVVPIAVTFLIFEFAKIMMDVMVCVGPFVLVGYLFESTKGIADRWIGKLIGLTILTLLIDVVLSIILDGDRSYYNVSMTSLTIATVAETVTICIQFVVFLSLGCLITGFLPAIAGYLGGGVSFSPLGMIASTTQAGRLIQAARGRTSGKKEA